MYAQNNALTVTGIGRVSVQANQVAITLGVVTLHEQATVSEQENARRMTAVIAGMKELGIEESSIQTTGFDIVPRYDYSTGEQIFIGYEVANRVSVRTKDLSLLPKIIDTAVTKGANEIGMLTFSYDNPSSLESLALERALKNANDKARSITNSLSLPFRDTPANIIEQDNEMQGPRPLNFSPEALSTPTFPGQITLTTNLRVTYHY